MTERHNKSALSNARHARLELSRFDIDRILHSHIRSRSSIAGTSVISMSITAGGNGTT